MTNIVLIFPGQGAYSPGLFGRLCTSNSAAVVTMLRVAREEFRIDLGALAHDQRSISDVIRTHPREAQLAIYIEAVNQGMQALAAGVNPATLIGHSYGEIAALTVAGCFSVADGTRVVGHRIEALRLGDETPGAMLAVAAEVDRVAALIRVVAGEGLSVAGVNAPDQAVVSGPREQIDALAAIAKAARIPASPIPAPHAFHHPALAGIARDFAASIRSIPSSGPKIPTYSPILHRAYRDDDDLAALLASHLVEPFDFAAAVRTVTAQASDGLIVECGAGKVLTTVLKRSGIGGGWATTHSDPAIVGATEWAALVGQQDGEPSIAERIRARGSADAGHPREEEIARFWDAVGPELEETLRRRFEHWQAEDAAAAASRPAARASGVTPPVPGAPAPVGGAPLADGALQQQLAELYAEALEYPVEVFLDELSVQLEADLGVDSVKQTDLLGRAAERFGLPIPEEGFSVAEYPTFESIVVLLQQQQQQHDGGVDVGDRPAPPARPTPVEAVAAPTVPDVVTPAAPAPASAPAVAGSGAAALVADPDLVAQLAELYAEALEYPVEVFLDELSVQLEADLGVDSVKQTDLLGRAAERFGLPIPEEGFSVAEYPTFESIVVLLQQQRSVVSA